MIIGNAGTFSASLNFWGIIATHIHTQHAYFDFNIEIPN
jgi:hypothetical protein